MKSTADGITLYIKWHLFFFFFSYDACAVFFPILMAGPKINVTVYAQLVRSPQFWRARNPVLIADDWAKCTASHMWTKIDMYTAEKW